MKERTVKDNGGRKQTDLITNIRLFAFFRIILIRSEIKQRFAFITSTSPCYGLKLGWRREVNHATICTPMLYGDDKASASLLEVNLHQFTKQSCLLCFSLLLQFGSLLFCFFSFCFCMCMFVETD